MNQTLTRFAAVLASLLCLAGGLWILLSAKNDAIGVGIGLYFIGKAFFVGPTLWLAAGARGQS